MIPGNNLKKKKGFCHGMEISRSLGLKDIVLSPEFYRIYTTITSAMPTFSIIRKELTNNH